MNIPETRKVDIKESFKGIQVSDPYRWLENSEDIEVRKWIQNQNEYTNSILKNGYFQTFSSELVKNFKVVNFSNPFPVNGRYFYTERQPDEDQFVLYMKKGLNGAPIALFNPNKEGGSVSIDYWNHSETGKYIAYGISEGGNEISTLYIKNTDTNQQLAEKILRCRHSSIQWLPDDSGFFYTRNAREGTVPKNEENLHSKLFLHILGKDPNNDELIFGENRPKDDMIEIVLSPDGKYLGIKVSRKWSENEIYIYNVEKKEIKPLITGIPSKFSICFLHEKVLISTNYKANNYRVVSATYENLFKPFDEWSDFIHEREFPLNFFRVTKSKILAEYLVNVCSEVIIFDHQGREIGKIPLSQYSSLAGISGDIKEEEFFYGVNSFIFPKVLYRYDPVTLEYVEYQKTDNPINSQDYEVKQEWYISKDATRVPLFIFHKRSIELKGSNPTILYGYGGFNNSKSPSFMRGWVSWIERGGIFAVANVRGGGEFGEKWHKGGMRENKQNSFDDFIIAAEYLISQKYTSSEHLAIYGGSNGGLLVSAVAVQRPDLFKAVCASVPLTDMVRFPKFGMAVRWIHEYGNPEIKEDLERILRWSPYHNVSEGKKYPSFLFTTADNDTRVDPLHARKMTAMLQRANKGNEKTLLFTEIEAGHGGGKPVTKIVESQALILSFFAQELSLKI